MDARRTAPGLNVSPQRGSWFAQSRRSLIPLHSTRLHPKPQTQQNTKLETLRRIEQSLCERPQGFADCVAWARLRFEELFNNTIRQLLHNFPIDQVRVIYPRWSNVCLTDSSVRRMT